MSSDFYAAWTLSRGRLDADVAGLTQAQLNFRLHPGVLTIGEMLLHVVGVEIWFMAQLKGEQVINETLHGVCRCATEGVVNENPFPFTAEQITPEFVDQMMTEGRRWIESLMPNPPAAVLTTEMKSALGPVIDGRGAFTRLAFHSAYHQGQVQMIRTAPGFPAG